MLWHADLGSRATTVMRLQAHAGNAVVQRLLARPAAESAAGGDVVDEAIAIAAHESIEPLLPDLGGHAGGASPLPPPGAGAPRAGAGLSPRVVQRDPDPPDASDPTAPGLSSADLVPYEPFEDVLIELDVLPHVLEVLGGLQPDEAAKKRGLPPELVHPTGGAIVTENKIVHFDGVGNAVAVSDPTKPVPIDVRRSILFQVRTGEGWLLFSRQGEIDRARAMGQVSSTADERIEAQDSVLLTFLPGVKGDTGAAGRDREAGSRDDDRAQASRGSQAVGQGAGEGRARASQGTSGGGDGDGSRDRRARRGNWRRRRLGPAGRVRSAADDHAQGALHGPGPGPTQTKTGADDVIPTVNGKGDTVAVVVADKALDDDPDEAGEAPDSLLGRADAAGDALRADRNADASVRIEHGATTTAFAKPRAGGGGGQAVDPADATKQAKASGGRLPGERSLFDSDVNTAAWPAQIKSFGMQPAEAPITVSGATNDFTMEIDRGPDVLDQFQPISYSWELIRVDGMSLEDKIAAAQSPYGGKHVGMLSGDIRDVKREDGEHRRGLQQRGLGHQGDAVPADRSQRRRPHARGRDQRLLPRS